MSLLSLDHISKSFGSTRAVNDVSLDVNQGEFFGLLGPSGCGKTTTLRMIAGLEQPDAGSIQFENEDITNLPPERRGFGMVFQNYALFPHLDVFEHVEMREEGVVLEDHAEAATFRGKVRDVFVLKKY